MACLHLSFGNNDFYLLLFKKYYMKTHLLKLSNNMDDLYVTLNLNQ